MISSDIASFTKHAGWTIEDAVHLTGDASGRRYIRITAQSRSALVMCSEANDPQIRSFERVADWLRELGLSAPQVYAADIEQGFILIEDFGDGLVNELSEDPEQERKLYHLAVDVLTVIASEDPPDDLAFLDAATLTDMLAPLFALLPRGNAGRKLEAELRLACDHAFQTAFDQTPYCVALRDFHAANLLHLPRRKGVRALGLIDFQDAVLAPAGYDLASLVDDVRRKVPSGLRTTLIKTLSRALGDPKLPQKIELLSLQRNLRILGVLHKLGGRYLDFVPRCRTLLQQSTAAIEDARLAYAVQQVLRSL